MHNYFAMMCYLWCCPCSIHNYLANDVLSVMLPMQYAQLPDHWCVVCNAAYAVCIITWPWCVISDAAHAVCIISWPMMCCLWCRLCSMHIYLATDVLSLVLSMQYAYLPGHWCVVNETVSVQFARLECSLCDRFNFVLEHPIVKTSIQTGICFVYI